MRKRAPQTRSRRPPASFLVIQSAMSSVLASCCACSPNDTRKLQRGKRNATPHSLSRDANTVREQLPPNRNADAESVSSQLIFAKHLGHTALAEYTFDGSVTKLAAGVQPSNDCYVHSGEKHPSCL